MRMACDLRKVNKGWSTAGLQENREQTRSNTLLLGAAEESEDSQPACESTVDSSLVKPERTAGRNLPQFVLFIMLILVTVKSFHRWWDINPKTPEINSVTLNITLSPPSISSVPKRHSTMGALQL